MACPFRYICAATIVFLLCVTGSAGAQAAGGQTQGGGAQAAQVPLSGRGMPGGSVTATQTPAPGPSTGINTLNATVSAQGPFIGSLSNQGAQPFGGTLSLRDAVQRGLSYNLSAVSMSAVLNQAHGQQTVARGALLPTINGEVTGTRQQTNLGALGVRFESPIPGFSFPTIVGPFNNIDLRARLSQTVLDLTALNNYRAAGATLRADQLMVEDTRDLIVLAVGGAYLQAVTAGVRAASAQAQLDTANALFRQNTERRQVGLVAQVDVARSQVQALTQQQRLISLQNEFAKQKINLARMIGLPPTDQYSLSDIIPFEAAPTLSIEDALDQARMTRGDLKAAAAHIEAAERALAAARAQRLPVAQVSADVGAIGPTPGDARRTFSVVGTVRVPLWAGRIGGQIQQAEAAVTQRRAEMDDLTSQLQGDVHKTFLDLQALTAQVEVADQSRQVAQQALDLTRQRFDAGVSDSLEVIQAQEALANAELDYINSVYAHNIAKLTLARSVGQAAERLPAFLKLP